ncbi:MAG: hypothetical protein KJ622_15755 [Alphaproteobacteria bacterium]|nr:hypothetical protein [Alphaproteobacteria bacterium]
MSASVVSLSGVRERYLHRPWSNQDIAEIYRVADTLRRAGLPIDFEEGQTDEGDPWYAFCNANTGDVIIHFAYIDGRYVAEVAHLGATFTGENLRDIVSDFLNSFPVILPHTQAAAPRVWMHPGSAFVAFVATLYFLLEMTNTVEAREAASQGLIDGEAFDDGSNETAYGEGGRLVYIPVNRDPYLRFSRGESEAADGVRSVAVSAAILIAGVLMDWHRSSGESIAFEPESILSAILNTSEEDLGDAIIDAACSMRMIEPGQDAGKAQCGEVSNIRTAHLVDAGPDPKIEFRVAGDLVKHGGEDGLVIDLDGEFGDAGKSIGDELLGGFSLASEAEGNGKVLNVAAAAGRQSDTIVAGEKDGQGTGNPESGEDSAPGPGGYPEGQGADVLNGPNFLETIQQSSTVTLLQSLGLRAETSGTSFETDLNSLVVLISNPPVAGASTASTAPTTSIVAASVTDAGQSFVTAPDSTLLGTGGDPTSTGGIDGGGAVLDKPATSTQGPASNPVQLSGGPAGSALPLDRDLDFSIFDPVEVLRAFVQTVEKVGFMHHDDIFYLYDAVALETEPSIIEFESIYLENGDEVNLLGQADTFDQIYVALS